MAGGKTLNLMAGRNHKNVQPFQANVPFPLAVQAGNLQGYDSEDEEATNAAPDNQTPIQKLRKQYSYKHWRNMPWKEKRRLLYVEKTNRKRK